MNAEGRAERSVDLDRFFPLPDDEAEREGLIPCASAGALFSESVRVGRGFVLSSVEAGAGEEAGEMCRPAGTDGLFGAWVVGEAVEGLDDLDVSAANDAPIDDRRGGLVGTGCWRGTRSVVRDLGETERALPWP